MRTMVMVLGWLLGACVCRVGAEVPWSGGEALKFQVHWGVLLAAEAEIRVSPIEPGWEAVLQLDARGVVRTLYPIRSRFVSRFGPSAGQSFGLEAVRSEGGREKHQRLVLDPEQRTGHYTDVLNRKERRFALPDGSCQDVLSLLYAARMVSWEQGMQREWDVGEREKLKRVRLTAEGEESIPGIDGMPRACWILRAEEQPDRKGRPPKDPHLLRAWVEQDGLRPLRADLQAPYGTFRLTRVEP